MNNLYYKKYNKYKLKYLNATNINKLYGGASVFTGIDSKEPEMPKFRLDNYERIIHPTYEIVDNIINNVIAFYGSKDVNEPDQDYIDKHYGFQCLGNFYPCVIEIEINSYINYPDKMSKIKWTFNNAEAAFQAAKFNKIIYNKNIPITALRKHLQIDNKNTLFDNCFGKKIEQLYTEYNTEIISPQHIKIKSNEICLIYFFTKKFILTGQEVHHMKKLLLDIIAYSDDDKPYFNSLDYKYSENFEYGLTEADTDKYNPTEKKFSHEMAWMYNVITNKFENNLFKYVLLSTGNTFLIEYINSKAEDSIRSNGVDGKGSNMLGLILMLYRETLMPATLGWINYYEMCQDFNITDDIEYKAEKYKAAYAILAEKLNVDNLTDNEKLNVNEIKSGLFTIYKRNYLFLPKEWTQTVTDITSELDNLISNKHKKICDIKKEQIKNLSLI